jgi:hypothetical protein
MKPKIVDYARSASRRLTEEESNVLAAVLKQANLEPNEVGVMDVTAPFLLAGNDFDLSESNNTNEFVQCEAAECHSFLGGCCYSVIRLQEGFRKGYILHTNLEGGNLVFVLS